MKNSTLAELAAVLQPKERDDLLLFLHSPWCNDYAHPADQAALLRYLWQHPEPDKDEAYAHIFPHTEAVENKLEKLMSATLKALRRWLLLRRREGETEEHLALAAFYSSRSLLDRFDLAMSHARAALDKKTPHELRDYLLRYHLEYEISTHQTLHNQKKDDANFNRTLAALDRFYLAARLKNTFLLLMQMRFVPLPDAYTARQFLQPMLAQLRPHAQVMAPIVEVYEQMLALIELPDAGMDDLQGLLALLQRHDAVLDAETLDNAESFACNFCTAQYNHSRYEYLPVLYDLLLHRLRHGRLYKDGLMPINHFQQLVAVGLRMKQPDWVRDFLEQHRGRLVGGRQADEAWDFNYARYLLHTGQQAQALDLLAANYEEMQYKFAAKVLEIQALYETDSPLLDSKLDAAKVFFFREKKLPDDKKALYNDFVDMMKQIIHPKTLHDPGRIRRLIEKVNSLPGIAERDWVLQRLEDLLEGKKP
ncbi:MAG TPA: hypothetical protein PK971_05440, partial [Saprospiraceae bacterium]|nr:hypothetical protein [Saprospiraceae bacterium]HND87745.1 hypothetical protein [Saprospiraceae bacterium]